MKRTARTSPIRHRPCDQDGTVGLVGDPGTSVRHHARDRPGFPRARRFRVADVPCRWHPRKMPLRNPGAIKAAIDAVTDMQRLLQNARHEANVTGDKRDGFVRWCDNYARPQLRSIFAPAEELLAELDSSQDRIM